MKRNTARNSHRSGSPTEWKARREAYQETAGPVSNPGRPSLVNRKARRQLKMAAQSARDATE